MTFGSSGPVRSKRKDRLSFPCLSRESTSLPGFVPNLRGSEWPSRRVFIVTNPSSESYLTPFSIYVD